MKTNPYPVPPHVAGIAVFVEGYDVVRGKVALTLYQTGPEVLDLDQAIEVLRMGVGLAELQKDAAAGLGGPS